MRSVFTASRVLLALALCIGAAAASCSVDYAGILAGKACDSSGTCADGFTCDRQTMSCISEGQYRPDASGDGGADAGGIKDTGHPLPLDAGARDTGRDDAGTGDDSGTADDTGFDDAGQNDTGNADVGPTDTGGDDAGSTDVGPADTGNDDTGHDDAGNGDSGVQDAGVQDTGPVDAGSDAGTTVCRGGELRCTSDAALEQCTPDGAGWAPKETCQTYCLTDHCAACRPGATMCEGATNNLMVCKADGTGMEWDQFCTGYCLIDRCVECKPGDTWCDANGDLSVCQPDGIDISVTQCPSGCDDLNLRCYACVPDDQWCDGNVAKHCHGDGMAFDPQDCCIANTCESGQCTDTSPHIGNAAPLDGNAYTDTTITIDGCQFAGDAVVEFWLGSSWSQPSNGSITGRTSTTRIVYKLTNIQPPRNKDYPMRVRNPGGGTSNQVTFHVNN